MVSQLVLPISIYILLWIATDLKINGLPPIEMVIHILLW